MSATRKKDQVRQLIEDTVERPDQTNVSSRLESMGFPAPQNLVDSFRTVSSRLAIDRQSYDQLATLSLDLLGSPSPVGAMVNFVRFLETSGASGVFLNTMAGGKPLREILATVFGTSQYMSDIIIRNPGYLYWLVEMQTWDRKDTTATYTTELERDITNFHSVETKLDAVRRFQRRMLLKIGVKDLLGIHTIEKTTSGLSDLADVITSCVLNILWNDATGDFPKSPGGFAVLALGKLGGGELNYSSDIDLIYVCEDTDDDTVAFYHKLAGRLTKSLSEVTAEGYLYRVDLRLRPDGDVGPLVSPLTSMIVYYESRGRPWEFQAMLKARAIAGDVAMGRHFLERISGMAFNPTLSYSPVEVIAVMRKRIRENISTRDRAFNIKLMEGGIRDIEFILQTLQLHYGNKHPELRVTNTLEGIRLAYAQKLIKKLERDTLVGAYLFFRLVEHRLQMMHQLKTHSIPESHDEIRLLAGRVSRGPLGTFSYNSFLSTLTTHLNKIRVLSDSFFAEEDLPEPALLLLLAEDDDLARDILGKFGISDYRQAISIIQSLAYGTFPDLVDPNTRASFQKLIPSLLEDFSRSGDPGVTLINFSRIAAAGKSRRSFYDFLCATPAIRSMLCTLAGTSSLVSNALCKNIEILDTILEDPRELAASPLAPDLSKDVRVAGGDVEQRQRVHAELRKAMEQRLVSAWVVDLETRSAPRTTAQTIARATRDLVTSAFDAVEPDKKGVILLAMGSFAVGEPRTGSDVDLLVVTKDRELESTTRHIQAVSRFFSEGNLLKLDFRLRGEGASAPLVQDIDLYRSYFNSRVSSWEKVAFAKCACWAGDVELAHEFTAMLEPLVFEKRDREGVQTLAEVRRKLEGLVPKGSDLFETKRSAGGRYDIEYLCSIGMSVAGCTCPLDSSTAERLDILASRGVLSANRVAVITQAMTVYVLVDYLLDLQGFVLPTTSDKIASTARYLDKTLELLEVQTDGGIVETMKRCKRDVRDSYQHVVELAD